jgi:hypothetical protein
MKIGMWNSVWTQIYKFCTKHINSYRHGNHEELLCYIGQLNAVDIIAGELYRCELISKVYNYYIKNGRHIKFLLERLLLVRSLNIDTYACYFLLIISGVLTS